MQNAAKHRVGEEQGDEGDARVFAKDLRSITEEPRTLLGRGGSSSEEGVLLGDGRGGNKATARRRGTLWR